MDSYVLFSVVAAVTVMSPGPGVVLTLTNAIRHGASGALPGILGIAAGTFIVAAVSASSLGILLATSVAAFNIIKLIGAAYLVYLGLKLWFAPASDLTRSEASPQRPGVQFVEGLALQLTNPKAVLFFVAVFPQFIDLRSTYLFQFALLVTTYSALVITIRLLYARFAGFARGWMGSKKGSRIVSRLGGSAFIVFGAGLASTSK